MGKWTLEELLSLYRGSYSLHTRSYQVNKKDRPLRADTQFATLFTHVRDLADVGTVGADLSGRGVRNTSEHAEWAVLTNRARGYTPPDPAFVPGGAQHRIVLVLEPSKHRNKNPLYLGLSALASNGYAKAMRLVDRAKAGSMTDAGVWIWHSDQGYLRPATLSITQTYCVDAAPVRAVAGRPATPDFNHCDQRRPTQLWSVTNVRGKGTFNGTASSTDGVDVRIATTGVAGDDGSMHVKAKHSSADDQQLCLEAKPIEDPRFCGGLSNQVQEWGSEVFSPSRCLGAELMPCDEASPTQIWRVATPTFRNTGLLIERTEDHEMVLAGLALP